MFFILILLSACENNTNKLMSGDFSGRVIDAKTGEPISGAWVLIKYELYKEKQFINIPMDHSHKGGCVWNTITQTNTEGIFKVPKLPSDILIRRTKRGFVRRYLGYSVYKPGYISQNPRIIKENSLFPLTYAPRVVSFPHNNEASKLSRLEDYKMVRDPLEPFDRFHYLNMSTIGGVTFCHYSRDLKPYFIAIFNEMKNMNLPGEKSEPWLSNLHDIIYGDT